MQLIWLIICLLSLFAAVSVKAGTASDEFLKIKSTKAACKDFDAKLSELNPKNLDWGKVELKKQELEEVFKLMDKLPQASIAQDELAVRALGEDADRVLSAYFAYMGSDCPMARYKIANVLNTSTLKEKPGMRKRSSIAVLALLERPKQPTLINPAVDAAILMDAHKRGLVTVTDENLKALSALYDEVRAYTRKLNEKMDPYIGPVDKLLEVKDLEEQSKRLRENADFKTLKALLLEEAQHAKSFSGRVRALSAKAKAK